VRYTSRFPRPFGRISIQLKKIASTLERSFSTELAKTGRSIGGPSHPESSRSERRERVTLNALGPI
jgi:hypothetical protein